MIFIIELNKPFVISSFMKIISLYYSNKPPIWSQVLIFLYAKYFE